jgi:hypothetical protein
MGNAVQFRRDQFVCAPVTPSVRDLLSAWQQRNKKSTRII